MVFEESTFVLPAGPGKATTEVAEPAVQDPSKKPETVERSAPATVIKPPKIDTAQTAPVKRAAPSTPPKDAKKEVKAPSPLQTTPKRDPRRPQWDTSLVNKARNAPRMPHQSPNGSVKASNGSRPSSAAWGPTRDSQPSSSPSDSQKTTPARKASGPVKHLSPWTLEGESVLDRNREDEDALAEDARKEEADDEASKKPTRQELRTTALEKGWVGNGTGPQIGHSDGAEEAGQGAEQKKLSPRQRFGIEGIIRTFTGEGPEGMSGHGKGAAGAPHISCRAGGADEDSRGSARSAGAAKRGRVGKCSCTGCSVM